MSRVKQPQTLTQSGRCIVSSKAEAFKKAAKEMIKTKRYPKQVRKTPARAPSYQEEQKMELKMLKLATSTTKTLAKGPVIDSAATLAVM